MGPTGGETPATRRDLGGITLAFPDFLRLARQGEPVSPVDVERAIQSGNLTPQQEADVVSMMVDPGYVPSDAELLAAEAPGLTPMAEEDLVQPTLPEGLARVGDYAAGLTGASRGEIAERREDRRQRRADKTDSVAGDIDDRRAAATRNALEDLPTEALPETLADPNEAERIGQETLRVLEETAPPPPSDDNTPSAKRTLRERYNQRLELFKDIFGESDEARARDRAMSLAMLGLAIASGQSPNALTNIAQGAMAGLQGMSEQERARREREQGLQQAALTSVLDEQAAAAAAEAEAEGRAYDRATRLLVERVRAASGQGSTYTPERLRQLVIDNVLSDPLEFEQLQDPDGTINPAKLNAYADAVVNASLGGDTSDVEDLSGRPAPEGYSPGQLITDNETGRQYRVTDDNTLALVQ